MLSVYNTGVCGNPIPPSVMPRAASLDVTPPSGEVRGFPYWELARGGLLVKDPSLVEQAQSEVRQSPVIEKLARLMGVRRQTKGDQ